MTYRWKVINKFWGFREFRTHSSYETETKTDAQAMAAEYVSGQKGNLSARKSEIYQIKTGRLRAVWYQDAITGRIVWKSERMEKIGHLPKVDDFDAAAFNRLTDFYHSVFDYESRPLIARVLRADLGRPSGPVDPDYLEALRTDLPADLANLHMVAMYTPDLLLYDAASTVATLAEERYLANQAKERVSPRLVLKEQSP